MSAIKNGNWSLPETTKIAKSSFSSAKSPLRSLIYPFKMVDLSIVLYVDQRVDGDLDGLLMGISWEDHYRRLYYLGHWELLLHTTSITMNQPVEWDRRVMCFMVRLKYEDNINGEQYTSHIWECYIMFYPILCDCSGV